MAVFDLEAKLGLDSSAYDKGLDKAEGKASSFLSGIGNVAKVGAAAVGAAATAIGALTKASVDSYGEYEQLVGGVQKLYGNMGMGLDEYAKMQGKSVGEVKGEWQDLEKAQSIVLENASNAYKNAGMDMNTYMSTATSFSAALINSLGGDTVKAAEQTDVAMRAISDNWNTFGGDIQMIQNAYQGFAKQNYTMLDNLKLGYGGTKDEMSRLIDDANEYAASIGEASDLSINSFSDIVTAIDLIQKKQNIAGTTAREAGTTIQGSLGMTKAAWENLKVSFSDPDADIGARIDQFVEAASVALNNLVPVISRALSGVGQLVAEGLPLLLTSVTDMINNFLPDLLGTATDVVIEIGKALPGLAKAIFDAIPSIFDTIVSTIKEHTSDLSGGGADMIDSLITGIQEGMSNGVAAMSEFVTQIATAIQENLPTLIETAAEILTTLMNGFSENTTTLIEMGATLITSILDGVVTSLPTLLMTATEMITSLVNTITENLPTLLDLGVEILNGIANGIIENLPLLLESAGEIITSLLNGIVELLPGLLEAGVEIITNLVNGISENLPTIIDTALEIIQSLVEGLLENLPEIISAGIELLTGLIDGLGQAIPNLIAELPEIISAIWDTITNIDWFTLGSNILTALINGLVSLGASLGSALLNILGTARETIKNIDWLAVGKNIISAIVNGIAGAIVLVVTGIGKLYTAIKNELAESKFLQTGASIINGIGQGIMNFIGRAREWGKDMLDNFISGIKDKISAVVETVKGVASKIKDLIGFSEPEEGPLSNFHTYAPDMMDLFIKGIKDNEDKLHAQIASSFDFGTVGKISSDAGVTKGKANTWDYEALGDAIANSIAKSNMGIKIGEREFGRVVRSAVRNG